MATAKTAAKKAPPKANGRKAKSSASDAAAKTFHNTLVVVESPAKAKTIKKYLGSGYTVKASVGHIMDLPKSKMGVDIENGFEPVYEVIKGKQKVVTELKAAAKNADRVLLATDPDREGEAIAWHVKQQIARARVPTQRVLFNEITKKAIQEAILKPLELNRDMYDAQQARRVLDRLVGYQISPILWTKVRRGLSAGRVQSVAVRLVVERENEIAAFVPVEYWSIEADLKAALPPQFRAKLIKLDGEKIELGSSAKKTMTLAQRLYEGMELGDEGQVALITYMRTDSVRLSPDAIGAAREYVAAKFGKDYLPPEPVQFKTKKSAQDAHEAIRPTSMEYEPSSVQKHLERDIFRLYELIWNRFIACQMVPAVFDQTTADIEAKRPAPDLPKHPAERAAALRVASKEPRSFLFRATGQTLKFPGYLAVYGAVVPEEPEAGAEKMEGEDEEKGDVARQLPPLEEGQRLELVQLIPEQHFTQPLPRFTEASLVKELEEKGIGRPSTYAAILSTIQDK